MNEEVRYTSREDVPDTPHEADVVTEATGKIPGISWVPLSSTEARAQGLDMWRAGVRLLGTEGHRGGGGAWTKPSILVDFT